MADILLWLRLLYYCSIDDDRSQWSVIPVSRSCVNRINDTKSARYFSEDGVLRRKRVVVCHNEELTTVCVSP